MTGAPFVATPFSAPVALRRDFLDLVVKHLPKRRPLRVLDIGCGSGELSCALAEALPDATVLGIDVSRVNIAAARVAAARLPQVRFEAVDYRNFSGRPFDVIVAWGVLHLIPGTSDRLAQQISHGLAAGGVFAATVPDASATNAIVNMGRRVLRACRCGAVDRALMSVARRIHGREFSNAQLQERIAYAYRPALRTSNQMCRALRRTGLQLVLQTPETRISLAQLQQSTIIFAKP